jgi:type IV secretory pathway component VirB8
MILLKTERDSIMKTNALHEDRLTNLYQHLCLDFKQLIARTITFLRQNCFNQRQEIKSVVKEMIFLFVFAVVIILMITLLPSKNQQPVLLLNGADQVVAVRLPDGKLVNGHQVFEYTGKGYREEYW